MRLAATTSKIAVRINSVRRVERLLHAAVALSFMADSIDGFIFI